MMTSDRQDPNVLGTIRRARPSEAGALSDLAFRSKGHWGYDIDFMVSCRDDLTLSPDDIETTAVYVLDDGEGVSGFHRLLVRDDGVAELDALFVEPGAIGRGVGKRLWQHAVLTSKGFACREIVLRSDPHAEGFYLAMGARRAGEAESTVTTGRMLPLMRFRLHEDVLR